METASSGIFSFWAIDKLQINPQKQQNIWTPTVRRSAPYCQVSVMFRRCLATTLTLRQIQQACFKRQWSHTGCWSRDIQTTDRSLLVQGHTDHRQVSTGPRAYRPQTGLCWSRSLLTTDRSLLVQGHTDHRQVSAGPGAC